MTIFTPNTPPASQVLSITQPLLQSNLDYLQATGNVDHNYANDTATPTNGFHENIRMIAQAVTGAGTGVGQLWMSSGASFGVLPTEANQLYYSTPGGVLFKLSEGAYQPVASPTGAG